MSSHKDFDNDPLQHGGEGAPSNPNSADNYYEPERTGWTGFNPLRAYRRHLNSASKPRSYRIAETVALSAAAFGIVSIAGVALWLACNKLPDVNALQTYAPVEAIKIFDKYDKPIAVVSGPEDRVVVTLDHVSPYVKKALMAAEDHEFYRHTGINPSSIARAMLKNLAAGRVVEGGSTITQQLVKNMFFPGEARSFNRKIKEFFLAAEVDRKYPKDKIMELYLNQIYFGNQSYGIERAAQRYFNKPAAKLSIAESAFLAGLIKAPSHLSAKANRQEALERQRVVLSKMAEYGFASEKDVEAAKHEKLVFRQFVSPFQRYPFYVSSIMDLLRERYDEQELQRGLKVYTYLDPKAQELAEAALNKGISKAPGGVTQGALVSLKVDDGGVIAIVGGAGKFEGAQWNRATSPHTMGSSFKPFVYLAGFMQGLTPDSIIMDTAFSVPSGGFTYTPRNFDGSFMGPLPVWKALAFSRNVCAVRVAAMVGMQNVISVARAAGITSRLDPYLPVAIGACAASPLEMAGAYATFARGGVYLTPHLVRRVDNSAGNTIYIYDEMPKKVFDSNATAMLVQSMESAVNSGTAILAKLPGRPVAGKTGTSDKSRDIWFVGFTSDTCTALWGGNDHNKAINNRAVTGGMIMTKIWKDYMKPYYDTHPTPVIAFMKPSKDQSKIAINVDSKDPNMIDQILTSAAVLAPADAAEAKLKADEQKAKAKAASKKAAAERERKLIAAREAEEQAADEQDGYEVVEEAVPTVTGNAPHPYRGPAPDAAIHANETASVSATATQSVPSPAPVVVRTVDTVPAAAPPPRAVPVSPSNPSRDIPQPEADD